ncbi:MAG: ABC transporter permease subunit [Pseudonocardiaceae bacterium]|nr:ABC transporter permease subunit [Pseudonocardiaceae bacterium]
MTTAVSGSVDHTAQPAQASRQRRSGPRTLSPSVKWMLRLSSVAAILLAWEIYGRSINPILLSYPTAVANAAADMMADGTLPQALSESLVVLGMGSLIGVSVGLTVGLFAGRSQIVAALLELPMNALYATPSVALIPVIVLWFGFGPTAKTVVVMLFVLFPVLINTMRGVQEVDAALIEVARSFCSRERRMWRDLIFPSAVPYIVTGLRLAIGRALIGVIVAEFFTAFAGLGNLIVTNANQFRTDRMFVPIVVIALFGVLLTALLEWVERRIVRWHGDG